MTTITHVKGWRWLSVAFVLMAVLSACSSPSAPAVPVSLVGSWTGTANDSQGATLVQWTLAQSGQRVSGTVTTQAVNPADGSCNACHRNKSGTFSGTIEGTTLTLSMFFAAGVNGNPTPACSATMTGMASNLTPRALTARYSGDDTCEGPFLEGVLPMARVP